MLIYSAQRHSFHLYYYSNLKLRLWNLHIVSLKCLRDGSTSFLPLVIPNTKYIGYEEQQLVSKRHISFVAWQVWN